jgi:hypothetical protein
VAGISVVSCVVRSISTVGLGSAVVVVVVVVAVASVAGAAMGGVVT